MRRIFGTDYDERKQHSENNYGIPCTQYRFIFDPNDKNDWWDLPEEKMPRHNCCFFRIDSNSKGWYIAIRMYFMDGATKNQSDDASKTRNELLNLIKMNDDVVRLSGKKEKTLLLFNIDSMEKLNECCGHLKSAAQYLLSRI